MEGVKKFFKKVKWETLVTAVLAVLVGIVLICEPENSGNVICYVSGVVFLIMGLTLILKYFFSGSIFGSNVFVLGLLLFAVGLFALIRPETVKGIITFIFGSFLVVDGFIKMQEGIDCSKMKVKNSWLLLFVATLSITLGFMVMFGTFESIMLFAGISLIIDGVSDVIMTLVFSSYIRRAEKKVKKVIESKDDNIIDIE